MASFSDEIGSALASAPPPPAATPAPTTPTPTEPTLSSEIGDLLSGKTPPPSPSEPKAEPSLGKDFASGLVSGAGARGLGMVGDVPTGFVNHIVAQARGFPDLVKSLMGSESPEEYLKAQKAIQQHPLINPSTVPLGSEWWNKKFGEAGLPTTENVQPQEPLGKLVQKATELGSAYAMPGAISKIPGLRAAEAFMPGNPGVNAAIGAGSGAAGEAAAETIGEKYRPLAEAGTGLIGGGVPAAASKAWEAVPPMRAGPQEAAAQAAATRKLGALASDPEQAAAQIRTEITGGRQELVPGSVATTAELANDPGLLSAQHVRERDSASPILRPTVQEQRAQANEARFGALEGMAPKTAGPEESQAYLRRLLARSDQLAEADTAKAQTAATTAQAAAAPTMTPEDQGALVRQAVETERAPQTAQLTAQQEAAQQAAAGAMGGLGGKEAVGSPEEQAAAPGQYGERMREPAQAAYNNERNRLSELRAAIDPNGTMGMRPDAIKQAVGEIGSNFSPDMFGGVENKLYSRVGQFGDLIPIEDAFRLRADINGRLKNVLDHNPQEQLRLVTLKRGVDQALADAVSDAHRAEQAGAPAPGSPQINERIGSLVENLGLGRAEPTAGAAQPTNVPRGTSVESAATTPENPLENERVIGPNFASDVARAYATNPAARRIASRDEVGRGVLDLANEGDGSLRAGTVAGGAGSGSDQGAGPGHRQGDTGVPQGSWLTPLTPEARQQFAEWNQQYGEMKRTFSGETPGQLHAVGKILQKGGAYDEYKLKDDEVPWAIAGPRAPPEAVDRFLAATPPEAHAALDDAFAFSLRRDAQNPDGTLNLKDYQKWLDSHQDKLTRRPELLEKFGSAAEAQRQLDTVNEALAQHLADYPLQPGWGDAGILPKFWKAGPQGGELMRRYMEITGGRPEAVQAAADYAAYDFANRPGVIKNGQVVPSAADAWIKQRESALSAMPGLKDRFADAATAQRTLEDVIAQHLERRADYVHKVAGAFVQDDPLRAIDRVFTGSDRAKKAATLMGLNAKDSAATEGIQRATIDYIRRQFEGAAMPGSESGALAANKFGHFVDDNKDVLGVLFPGRVKLFETIAEDAKRGQLVANARMPGGSDTAENLAHMTTHEAGTSPLVAGYIAERVAEHTPQLLGEIPIPGFRFLAGLAGYFGTRKVQAARGRVQLRADQLFDQMLLDPKTGADALTAYRALQNKGDPATIRDRFLVRSIGQAIQISRGEDLDKNRPKFARGGRLRRAEGGEADDFTGDPEAVGAAAASKAMEPVVTDLARKGIAGELGVPTATERLAGEAAHPDGSFAQRVLDPQALATAQDVALSAGPGKVGEALRGAPPHIQSPQALGALRTRLIDMAQEGEPGRNWYEQSGRAVADVSGGDIDRADKFAQALGVTSPSSPVAQNTEQAIRAHNQAMVGEPIHDVGMYPTEMGKKLNAIYYGDQPWAGRKTNAFYGNIMHPVDPSIPQSVTNDIWMMRGFEYPPTGEWQATKSGAFSGSPTKSAYDFVERETKNLTDRLNQTANVPWDPKQVQAAIWTAIKARSEGKSPDEAAFDFSHGLNRSMAQQSFESIPGRTTGHLQEMFDADPELLRDYHKDIVNTITDPEGRDLINRHFGLLTGKTFDAPGAFEGAVHPGSQARSAVSPAKGSGSTSLDPASKELLDAAEYTRGLLLAQDAAAWHRPFYRASTPAKDRNLAEVHLGRPLSEDEAKNLYDAMSQNSGSDFFAPIGAPNGARFLNVPDVTGMDNPTFQAHVSKSVRGVFGTADVPGVVEIRRHAADSGYLPIDWEGLLNGKDYREGFPSGRPDLQRRSAELLSALGPQIAKVQDRYAKQHGWTTNPSTRIWEQLPQGPEITVPSPPAPWRTGIQASQASP